MHIKYIYFFKGRNERGRGRISIVLVSEKLEASVILGCGSRKKYHGLPSLLTIGYCFRDSKGQAGKKQLETAGQPVSSLLLSASVSSYTHLPGLVLATWKLLALSAFHDLVV